LQVAGVANTEILAERVFVSEKFARKGFVNHGDAARGVGVLLVDEAATRQARSNGFEIMSAYRAKRRTVFSPWLGSVAVYSGFASAEA
jgi:hypothetical protein